MPDPALGGPFLLTVRAASDVPALWLSSIGASLRTRGRRRDAVAGDCTCRTLRTAGGGTPRSELVSPHTDFIMIPVAQHPSKAPPTIVAPCEATIVIPIIPHTSISKRSLLSAGIVRHWAPAQRISSPVETINFQRPLRSTAVRRKSRAIFRHAVARRHVWKAVGRKNVIRGHFRTPTTGDLTAA